MMKKLLLALVKFYRVAISPYRPPCCRYGWHSGGSCAATRFTREDMIRSREGGDRPLQPIPHRRAFHPPETAECGRAAGGGLPSRGQ